jgi:hypothetical protein
MADNAAPLSTTTNNKHELDSNTSYDNDCEHEWNAPSTCDVHEHASTNIGEGGEWLSKVGEITTPVVAVPFPFCSHGDKFSYFISIYIYLCR